MILNARWYHGNMFQNQFVYTKVKLRTGLRMNIIRATMPNPNSVHFR